LKLALRVDAERTAKKYKKKDFLFGDELHHQREVNLGRIAVVYRGVSSGGFWFVMRVKS